MCLPCHRRGVFENMMNTHTTHISTVCRCGNTFNRRVVTCLLYMFFGECVSASVLDFPVWWFACRTSTQNTCTQNNKHFMAYKRRLRQNRNACMAVIMIMKPVMVCAHHAQGLLLVKTTPANSAVWPNDHWQYWAQQQQQHSIRINIKL